jgi:hypothetical protein
LLFSAAIALCQLEAPERSSCREKNTLTPQLNYILIGSLSRDIWKKGRIRSIGKRPLPEVAIKKIPRPLISFEPRQRVHSPQLAAGLASESENR